jgi:hypothetical protein
LTLYLYGHLYRLRSSRRLEQETQRKVELLWLLKKLRPDRKTIANVRKRNLEPRGRSAAPSRCCARSSTSSGRRLSPLTAASSEQ